MTDKKNPPINKPIPFKAETRQLLDILIHSLYSEHEVFLRELISNASDALSRISFEMLTNRDVLDAEAELAIWIECDPEKRILTIRDTGIGMTAAELEVNLGTIAHSGVRAFLNAVQQSTPDTHLSDLIGQFGVGFYSAFMVAESIRVVSRSFDKNAEPAAWVSTGSDTFTIEPAEKTTRGTEIRIQLKEDSAEFCQEYRLRQIIQKHSDYIPFPIYLGVEKKQANQQSALWRQQPRQVQPVEYDKFYQQLTLDSELPLTHVHMAVDAPVQLYALLYIPANLERPIFSPRKQDGIKLYARKVLIQDYCLDLLPEYFRFVVGVVDSEDIPLNVSRETIQSNRILAQVKKLVTSRVIDSLKSLGKDQPATYEKFWWTYGRAIKEGVISDTEYYEALLPLLRFPSNLKHDSLVSLDEYILGMKPEQKKIYYILGEDRHSVLHSPHLEAYRQSGFEILLMVDPLDSFILLKLLKYKDFELANIAREQPTTPPSPEESQLQPEPLSEEAAHSIIERFKSQLKDRVSDVRTTARLSESPARLVDPEGTINPELQRVYHLLNREFSAPKKILEINPLHPIIQGLVHVGAESDVSQLVIEQVFEDALLVEGLHPEPASMVGRIQKLIEKALEHQENPTSGDRITAE